MEALNLSIEILSLETTKDNLLCMENQNNEDSQTTTEVLKYVKYMQLLVLMSLINYGRLIHFNVHPYIKEKDDLLDQL